MTSPDAPSPAPARPRWRALLPDTRPWHSSRDFRLMWCAGAVTMFGSFLTIVAVPFQIKELTGSTLAVGAVGAVEVVPLVVFGLYGGALADAVDKRKLILWSEVLLGLMSAVLLVNALLPEPALWPLYAVAGLSSALIGIQRPAIDAIVQRIVPHDQLTAAAALNALRWQIGAIAGPSLAGVLIAYVGLRTAYAVDVATFAVSVALAVRLAPSPASHGAERPSLRGIAEGARYAWSRKELMGTYAVDLAATMLAFPTALFPFLAEDLGAPWALGLLYAAIPAGALLVSVTSGWTSRVHRHGRMVVYAAMAWGAAVAGAGWAGNIWLVLLCLMAAGGADMVSGLFRSTIWNQTIPHELRGRLAGIELLSYSLGPQAGQVRAGGAAALTSVRGSVWSGGVACAVGVGLIALALPALRAYDARTDEHAAAARAAAGRGTEGD